jgi:hypothetical protein
MLHWIEFIKLSKEKQSVKSDIGEISVDCLGE